MSAAVQLLQTRLVEKPWGRDQLPPPFNAPAGARIGEIWFEPPPAMPDLLVKYLFTSEKLSVQVHPSDETAHAGEAGKEECWLVLDAQPGARLAIGFDEPHEPQAVEAAARAGTIEDLLTWHEVRAGDVFFLPPGTVHAIGPGIALVEVQQTSDTTFRLYDYGRGRELHLERALAVATCAPYPAQHRRTVGEAGHALAESVHFRFDRIAFDRAGQRPEEALCALYSDGALVLPLEGRVTVQGGEVAAGPGECLYAPSLGALDFGEARVVLLARSL